MTKRTLIAAILLACLTVGVVDVAVSQDAPKTTPTTPTAPTTDPTTTSELAAAVAATAKDPEKELRYEFMSHVFAVNGTAQEIYIKMDSFTGKTWRFHASTGKWQPIPEPTGAATLPDDTYSRYELLSHDYFDTYGEDQELMLRVDMVSGNGWTYRGANGTWKEIGQDD
jgi:hypothetical protein